MAKVTSTLPKAADVRDFISAVKTAFDREPDASQTIENERVRLAEAQFAVHDFIGKFPKEGWRYAKPFGDLGLKILDVNLGAVDNLFKLPARAQRRDTSQIWCARAKLVFAVNAIIQAYKIEGNPKSIPDAVAEVIGWHREIWDPTEDKTRLMNWRKEFSACRIQNDSARELFQVGSELIKAYATNPAFLRKWAKGRARAASSVAGVFN
jgi:hypothetical protein